ncbi:MAG: TonB-dependent receptor plug domain-containing protein, partial [candidate division Zixibacteria bacterium]
MRFTRHQRKPNRLSIICLALSACLSLFGTSFAADEIDIAQMDLQGLLDNVVVSASKHVETLEEAPANVFIITREMMDNYGCENIGEALSLAPGIYITDDYSVSLIGIRGISAFGDWNSHVKVLVDGRPTSEQYAGTNSIDVPGVDIDNLTRIEVIKGPSSSLYGSSAFFGIVNLITVHETEDQVSLANRYYSGTKARGHNVRLSRKFGEDLSLFITANWFDQIGSTLYFEEFSDPGDNTLWALDNDGLNQFYPDSASFTGGFARDRNTRQVLSTHSRIEWRDFSLILHLSHMNTGLPQSAWGSFFAHEANQYKERNHYVDLGYSKQVNDKVNLSTNLSYNYYTWSDHILYNYGEWEVAPDYLPGPIWTDW